MRTAMQGVRRHTRAAAQAAWRAWAGPGRERDLAVQAAKAALAAWVAWTVTGWWLKAPMAFVAPWVAIVLVESTVYRSVAHGLQQLAAITAGTVVATGAALMLDSTMAAMALVLPATVLLGSWQPLGSQGVYAATGTLFVLTGGQVTITSSAARIAEAVFGAVVGIAVNALIRPPVYLRSTRAALEDAAGEARDILEAVADELNAEQWDAGKAGALHERALRLGRLVDQARSAIDWSRESLRINPRRRTDAVSATGDAYDDAVLVLDHVAVHTAGVTRTVLEAMQGSREAAWPSPQLVGPYADFLRQTASAVRLYSQTRFSRGWDDRQAAEALHDVVEELRHALAELRRQVPDAVPDDPDALATYGTLLAQAHRLAEQLQEP